MYPGNSEIFSALGYDALDLIFGINSKLLSEVEKRDLIHLAVLEDKNEEIKNRIQDILERDIDDTAKKNMLLELLLKEKR
ncbi:hypothetical protein [Aeribacillus sp. FSL M8-0235]|uniref:hypothetical protein n=1 Tax=Aeribacillus sp. FSL M8-0235 TaxID=2954576 RepID=UPI0030F78283